MKRTHFLLAALAAVTWTAFLLLMHGREIRLDEERNLGIALSQSRALFRQVVDLRTWNASHGGVYVEIDEETQPNPYLDVPDRDVVTSSGKRLTLVNPAYMTRQLAEISKSRQGLELHLTSLKPLRPGNAPDPWEREALQSFERGEKEQTGFFVEAAGHETFRYMAPLVVEKPCLGCHCTQGYSEGQVRGGLSITYPAGVLATSRTSFRRRLSLTSFALWLLGVGLAAAVASAWQHKQNLVIRLRELALVDELTGLHNRRGFLLLAQQRLQVARRAGRRDLLLFFDLNDMKRINDTYGHESGDAALRRAAAALRGTFRSSDIIARYGGDEFVALCPNTGLAEAPSVLESLKRHTAEENAAAGATWEVSLSAGAAEFDPDAPLELDELLHRADAAMYRAKQAEKAPAPRNG